MIKPQSCGADFLAVPHVVQRSVVYKSFTCLMNEPNLLLTLPRKCFCFKAPSVEQYRRWI